MKRNFLGLALILTSFFLTMLYIKCASGNIVFRDQLFLIKSGILDKYFSGTLSFQDIWRAASGFRILGYHLLFLLNATFFHLNTHFEMYLSSFVLLIICLLLFKAYSKLLTDVYGHVFIQASFILTSLVLFSLNQWGSLLFGFGFIFISPMLVFLITFFVLEKILAQKKATYLDIVFVFMMLVSILVFGGAYSFGFIGSIFIVIFFHFLTTSRQLNRSLLRILFLVIVTSTIGLVIYHYKIMENNYWPYQRISSGLELLSANMSIVRFLLLSVASSIIGCNFSNNFLNPDIILSIGALLVCIYIYSLRLYISSGLYSRTYLPLFLISYSWLVFISILFARFNYGITYGMASRYTSNTQYGIIAIIWIAIYNFQHVQESSKLRKSILASILMFILVGQFLTYYTEWKIAPYRMQHFEKMRSMAMNPESFSQNDLSLFEANNVTEIIESLEVLKKYNLNVYYDFTSQKLPQIVLKRFGPTDIGAGQPFNVQPSGESAIWAETMNASPYTVVVFNQTELKSVSNKAGTLVTALVPPELFRNAGVFRLYLLDKNTGQKSNKLELIVK